jgi:hypothetical protein
MLRKNFLDGLWGVTVLAVGGVDGRQRELVNVWVSLQM